MGNSRSEELDRIWSKTRTYRTAGPDLTTMADFYDALENSGYGRETYQRWDHLRNHRNLYVFSREQADEITERLERNGNLSMEDGCFSTRGAGEVYEGMEPPLHPSQRLNPDDMRTNPFLLELILGEILTYEYLKHEIVPDHENSELSVRCRLVTHASEGLRERGMTSDEATTVAYRVSTDIENLSKAAAEKRDAGPKLFFDYPYIYIPGRTLYKAGAIPEASIKLRRLEKRLEEISGINPRAEDSIRKGIDSHRESLGREDLTHFPCFRVMEQVRD